ncbi:hypothetical protein V8F20_005525 [Naviculisporaceae sp. PSN 640]
MPKKRHQTRYSKPQSTAPASLSSSGSINNNNNNVPPPESRSVNQLLASLRRLGINNGSHHPNPLAVHPTVPPTIRNILQLPETPAPTPRRPVRRDASGRRLPPGPAAPPSWALSAENASGRKVRTRKSRANAFQLRPLPGTLNHLPQKGSLMDMVLRRLARDWEFQKTYCQYYLYDLPTHIRMPLVRYVTLYNRDGVSVSDLRAILLPSPPDPEDEEEDRGEEMDASSANEDFTHLDLTSSCGRSLKLRELSDLLVPQQPESTELPDSWDASEEQAGRATSSGAAVPRSLLPNLTHLSLAVDVDIRPSSVSWRQLLSFASHHSNLTHLSLAYWPEPTLTPNAKFSSVVSEEGRIVQYGGTGAYSHTLDDDWSEAIMILSRLSKSLYELEYLDLTGCADWSPALWSKEEHDAVDWVGHWGKISTVLLSASEPLSEDAGVGETIEHHKLRDHARTLERHVRTRRAGQGRVFTVEWNDKN